MLILDALVVIGGAERNARDMRHDEHRWLAGLRAQGLLIAVVSDDDVTAIMGGRSVIHVSVHICDPGKQAHLMFTCCGRYGPDDAGALFAVAFEAELAPKFGRRPTGRVGMPTRPVAFVGEAAGLERVTDRPEDGHTTGDVPFA